MHVPQITLDIWMDGQVYASRRWPAVPRKGDLIFLRRKRGEEWVMEKAKVVAVVWGAAADETLGPTVALECQWQRAA